MSTLDYIMQTLPALSPEDKLLLRDTLDKELSLPKPNGKEVNHPLLGFMADEPELMDQIVEDAYALRALPLRLPADG